MYLYYSLPIYNSAIRGDLEEMIKIHNSLDEFPVSYFLEAMFSAIENGHVHILEQLVKWDVIVKVPSITIHCAFDNACEKGHLECARLFKRYIDSNDIDFQKLFVYVCKNGHLEVAKQLYEWAERSIQIEHNDDCAFRCACVKGNIRLIKQLLLWYEEQNKKVNTHSFDDYAFRNAHLMGYVEVVKMFCDWEPNYFIPLLIHRIVNCCNNTRKIEESYVEEIIKPHLQKIKIARWCQNRLWDRNYQIGRHFTDRFLKADNECISLT